MIVKPLTSFNAGELSPLLDGRVDLEKYQSGCRLCENFLLMPYGGVRRRPGLQYLDALRDESEKGRLLPFRFSTSDTYMLVFNDGYVRIYSGGATPAEVATEIATPYAAADLPELQYVQQNDVMYLMHPDHPVQKLSRTSATTFTLAEVAWDWAPMRDQNLTEAVTVQAESAAGTDRYAAGATVTIEGPGTSPAWTAAMVGTRMRIEEERPGADFEVALEIPGTASAAQSSEIQVQGGWQISITGFWSAGTISVQKWDGSGWVSIRSFTSENENRAVTSGGTVEEITRMRIDRDAAALSTAGGQAVLEATGPDPYGEVEITAFVGATTLTATVTKRLYLSPQIAGYPASAATNATSHWSEGAFSDVHGHPRAAAFHEGRLVFGGTASDAQTVWGSVSDDYENFQTGTEDDDSYRVSLAANEHNGIRWLVSERRLILGTSGGEFVIGGSDDSVVITPSNVRARLHSNYGSAPIQPVFAGDSIIYAQRQARKIRGYGYAFERDQYQATDLTVLSEHVTGTGILELAYQQQRDSVVWAVTAEGELIGMTYERDQAVTGWFRSTTGGSFESVSTIYGEGEEDEVWVIVKRTINSATVRYLERLEPTQFQTMQSADRDNYFYVDCGLKETGTALTEIALAHLEGEEVTLLADGILMPLVTVSSGVALLPSGTTADTIVGGCAMTSRIEPMKIDVPLGNGTARTREGRINRLGIVVWKSLGGHFGETAEGVVADLDLDPVIYRTTSDDYDTGTAVKTGEFELDVDADYREGVTIGIVNDSPYPMAILMLVAKLDFYGDN